MVRRPAQPVPPHHYTGSPVIGPMSPGDAGKKTLVLDLDETLVHSSFKPIPNPDYIIPVRPHCLPCYYQTRLFRVYPQSSGLQAVDCACRCYGPASVEHDGP